MIMIIIMTMMMMMMMLMRWMMRMMVRMMRMIVRMMMVLTMVSMMVIMTMMRMRMRMRMTMMMMMMTMMTMMLTMLELTLLRAYLAFLVIAFTFQLYMVPLLLAGLLMASFYKTNHIDVIVEKEVVSENSEELEEMMEKEKDENVSLNKILTLVQDAFPLIQNCLGLVASSAEKLKNTFNWSVPFLTFIALISLLVISVILFLVDLRTLVIILGSVKFIKNLILPGWESNNELLDFLSRVPDDRLLQETKEISR